MFGYILLVWLTVRSSPTSASNFPNHRQRVLKELCGCHPLHTLRAYDLRVSVRHSNHLKHLCWFPGHAHRLIKQAMDHWVKHVPCLRFVPRTNQRSYISFFAGGG